MGAVKDLVDLVTQLSNRIEDRKFAAELRDIQSMIGGIQSEHAAIHEQRIELMTENAELKQTIATLQQEIVALKREAKNLKNHHSQRSPELSEEAKKVLMFFTKHTEVTSEQISHNLSLDLTRTEHWLDILEKLEMDYALHAMEDETRYSIDEKGREYLVVNNMI